MFDALQVQRPFPPASGLENADGGSLMQLSTDVILNQYGLLRELGDDQRIFSAHKPRFMPIAEGCPALANYCSHRNPESAHHANVGLRRPRRGGRLGRSG